MDWDQSGELSGSKSAALYILLVNEFSGGPGVHKGIQGFNLCSVCGFHFHFQPEGLQVVFGGSNDTVTQKTVSMFGYFDL